jgi:serine phosphatase RsbU (regulator of sigma subunit)
MAAIESDKLSLTDFMDLATLQEIQDSFAAVANVKATITDASGHVLTQPVPTKDFLRRQQAIQAAEESQAGPQREGAVYVAPITVNNLRLGTIRMSSNGTVAGLDETKLTALGEKYGIDLKHLKSLATQLTRGRSTKPAAIQFLFLLANAIARLCFQEYQLRQRINELTALYNVSMMLTESRDLQKVLSRTVELVCQVMETKAASLRLIDRENDELVTKAVFNLSPAYLAKGPVRMSKSDIDRVALSQQGYEYVSDMSTDPRVQYPGEAIREGIVSMLSAGMKYKGNAIGVLRVYTEKQQVFSQYQIDLLKSIAAQSAAAIENTRLLTENIEAEALEKQVRLAADVQQRMLPQSSPRVPGLDIATTYVPCFALGGDFYDFVELPDHNLGIGIADVSGKGVPASLIMASVRAALRAQVDNVYYLYEVVRRINLMLYRDTKPSEFVTLFYGVMDAVNRRFTYCNAGHPPAMLLRNGIVTELSADNMVLGVSPDEPYKQSFVDLKSNDCLLLYTDGLTDAMNFEQKTFGRQRLIEVYSKGGATAEIVAQNILWEMRKFVGLTLRNDDVTMVVVRMQ